MILYGKTLKCKDYAIAAMMCSCALGFYSLLNNFATSEHPHGEHLRRIFATDPWCVRQYSPDLTLSITKVVINVPSYTMMITLLMNLFNTYP